MAYKLTAQDREIFKRAETDVNWFTNFYLRSPTSGTYWYPDDEDPDKSNAYEIIWEAWDKAGKPNEQLVITNAETGVETTYLLKEHTTSDPVFHHNHGFIMMPWQKRVHHAKQRDITIIGGYASAKTTGLSVSQQVYACMLRGYRGAFMAPVSYQSNHAWNFLVELMKDTLLEERFLKQKLKRPPAQLIFSHEAIGESSITYYTLGQDSNNMLSLEFDYIIVDQAEAIDDIQGDILNPLGSRLRGIVQGRSRMGRLVLLANSTDNPALWDRFDDAEEDPENMLSLKVSTYDNVYLTKSQIKDYERRFAGDEQAKAIHMLGDRPPGSGDHFPSHIMERNRNRSLEKEVQEKAAAGIPGYIWDRRNRVGIWRYETPPVPMSEHLLIADPGWDNPPNRNSAALMVWDITMFPMKPAILKSFWWVYGHNSPEPWINAYMELLDRYRCDMFYQGTMYDPALNLQPGINGFDSTGFQKGYNIWVFAEKGIVANNISLAGQEKPKMLNATKGLMYKGLLQMPFIPHLWNQCQKYRLPEPQNLRQDLVMTLIMTGGWLLRRYGAYFHDSSQEEKDLQDAMTVGRHGHHMSVRHSRPVSSGAPDGNVRVPAYADVEEMPYWDIPDYDQSIIIPEDY